MLKIQVWTCVPVNNKHGIFVNRRWQALPSALPSVRETSASGIIVLLLFVTTSPSEDDFLDFQVTVGAWKMFTVHVGPSEDGSVVPVM